uniref:Uncharacterized protein n=1 Tax=Chlamydomonas euryale TaxID=1486919 RepID=A0A7R9W1L7_9CHLO|mmetsp:Transcript_9088/g.27672  ORF Transcript_9088/g.27672 Transcript_9088/m.27672 type:complete len:233 (+) Transcript_9088:319-1017(+)
MELDSMMPRRMHPTLKKPCCNGKKKKAPWAEGTLNTEYRNQFQDKEVPYIRAGPRPDGPRDNGAFDDSTTYGDGFKHYQVPRAEPCKPLNSQSVEGLPFAGESTYRQGFGPKAVPYQKAGPPAAEATQSGPFDGSTTYGRAFPLRQVPAPPAPVTRATNIESSGPFVGESLYKSTFTNMGNAKRHPKRPGQERVETGPFCGDTTYRNTYVPKQAAPREPDCVPCCSDCDDDE